MSTHQAPAEISAAMQTVADYIVHAGDRPLPDEVTKKTRHHVLDTLAAMVSGSRLPRGIAALKYYGLLRPVIRPKRAKALIDSTWNIERIGNVQELRSLLRA